MPAVPLISAVGTVAGVASSIKGQSDARKAANQAAAVNPQVNIADVDAQARAAAQRNAAESAALERQYNPGAQELRQGSLQALIGALGGRDDVSTLLRTLATQGAPAVGGGPNLARADLGEMPTRAAPLAGNQELLERVRAQAGQPLSTTGFDSALTRQAVEAASRDLAMGGQLPQDVRNLIARTAAARSGAVTGGMGLGRDINARDLGLTSLDVYNQRLGRAAALAQQEAALEQANAAMRSQAEQFGRQSLMAAQDAFAREQGRLSSDYATDAQIQQARAALEQQRAAQENALASQNYWNAANMGQSNYFNQANLLQNIQSGDFARALGAAQLGQNIAAPQSGLDPGAIANLAVGNVNANAAAQQNAAALRAQAGQQQTALGGQLLGTAAGLFANRGNTYTPPTLPAITVPTGAGLGSNIPSPAGFSYFK